MKRALLIIDYSNDFVDEKGVMSCGEAGRALDEPILAQIRHTLDRDDFVFVCNDAHEEGDAYAPEAVLFPPHNLVGSWGAEIYGTTGKLIAHCSPRAIRMLRWYQNSAIPHFMVRRLI